MTLNGQWIELFRAGNYGDKGTYTVADIDRMVRGYDPAKHEAPVVMGHPEHDAPAYGWVESLKRVGDVLMGKLKQVPAQFEELVKQGRFKKRSISLYRGEDGPSLRHVGFLGALPPEVKGLADVKMAAFGAGAFNSIDFEEDVMDMKEVTESLTRSMREFFADLFKNKQIEVILPAGAGDHSKLIAEAVTAALKPMEAKFTEMEKKFSDEQKARETAAAASTTATQAAFAEKHVQRVKDASRWLPAYDKMGLTQIFGELAKSPAKITFGEGDKKTEKPMAEAFADYLIDLGEIVPRGERAAEMRQTGKLVKFNDPRNPDVAIDQDSVALAEAATALMKKDKITYAEALTRVRDSGDWRPTGSAASGAV